MGDSGCGDRFAVILPEIGPSQVEPIQSKLLRNVGEVYHSAEGAVARFALVHYPQDGANELELIRHSAPSGVVALTLGPGNFTGEANVLTGRPALLLLRVAKSGEVIEIARERLLELIQADAELSQILMRALILRRSEILAGRLGDLSDALVIGSMHSPATLRVREFLTRNGHPFHYIDLDHDADAQPLLDRFHVGIDDIPAKSFGPRR